MVHGFGFGALRGCAGAQTSPVFPPSCPSSCQIPLALHPTVNPAPAIRRDSGYGAGFLGACLPLCGAFANRSGFGALRGYAVVQTHSVSPSECRVKGVG